MSVDHSPAARAALAIVDAEIARVSRRKAASSASARAARAADSSLEEGTLKQSHSKFVSGSSYSDGQQKWNLKLTEYSSGALSLDAFIGDLPKRRPVSSSVDGGNSSSSISRQGDVAKNSIRTGERFESSVRRSRKSLLSRCLELGADNLLTLGVRGKIPSLDQCWVHLKEFNRLMSIRFGARWKYIAVPELHADGETFHIHLALHGFFSVEAVRVCWLRALGGKGDERGADSPGNVDFPKRRKHRHRVGVAAVRKLAGYLAKYIGKGASSCRAHRKLFACSRGLNPMRVTRWHCDRWDSFEDILRSAGRWLSGLGANAMMDVYIWSRHRPDESLAMCGFRLSGSGVLKHETAN